MKPAKVASGPKFEAALAELETIVDEMETANLPLEKLIERYEQGMKLVKQCGDKLSEAEQKVEILTRNQSAAPEAEEQTKSTGSAGSSEVSLF
jgi:exodeoxyribonuclease VII small subunit